MGKLLETLKAARKLEYFILLAMLAVLILFAMGGGSGESALSADEIRLQKLLGSIDGAGRVEVMITKNGEGDTIGAVITASGVDDLFVFLKLQRAVQALTDLDLSKIEIMRAG